MKAKFFRFIQKQKGFSLIEMVVTVALLTVLLAMATGGMEHYLAGKALDTSSRDLISQIREAQSLALATGNTYRLDFSGGNSYTLSRREGSDWVLVRGPINLGNGIIFDLSSPPVFGNDSNLDFYARGASESGQLKLSGRYSKTRMLYVEGETVNVVVSH